MNKRAKGALAMVLAGAVTFSIINALVTDQSSKRTAEENAAAISGNPKKADVISQVEKTVNGQTSASNAKDTQTALSHNNSDIQQDKEELAKVAAINSTNTDTAAATTASAAAITSASIKTPPKTTSIPATTGTNPPSETTTTIPAAAGTNTPSETSTTVPAAAGTDPSSGTTTATPTTTGTNTTSGTTTTAATTTTTNHGQQVSQEKAASRLDRKTTSSKKI